MNRSLKHPLPAALKQSRIQRRFPIGVGTRCARSLTSVPAAPACDMCGLGLFVIFFLLSCGSLHATVTISEFMASNDGVIRDDFGDASDWIELHNTGTIPVNLLGWALADRTSSSSRWFFPSHVMEPDAYLVVFASGRNRKLPGAPLHTSFSLSADGEYLVLLRPNGTKAVEFAPSFPRQVPDVSYGFARSSTETILVPGAAGQAGVPVSMADYNLNFANWQTALEPLTGPSWQNIQTGVGFDLIDDGVPFASWIGMGGNIGARMLNLNESTFIRIPFVIGDVSTITALRLRMRYDDGFIAYLNGIQVAAEFAPANPTWNSGAIDDRRSAFNENPSQYVIAPSVLQVGTNILAVHGLNHGTASGDFLVLPTLELNRALPANDAVYFVDPTPGTPNGPGGPLGPALTEATSILPRPLGNAASPGHAVSVRVTRTKSPVQPSSICLFYRVMFEPETGVTLRDDGVPPDLSANDGLYAAMLPTAMVLPGQMLRWRYEAADNVGNVGRAPPYLDPEDADLYFGTVAQNSDETLSQLPIFHQFIQDPLAADNFGGTRASVFYLGQFYDNVRIDPHGQSSLAFPKKSYNLDFNADNRFVWNLDAPRRVKDIDLLSNYADKTRLRNTLAHEVARRAAAPYHFAFPVRVQRNGAFHGVMDLMEDGDDRMLERNALDPEGALYKIYDDMSSTNNALKKTRQHEDYSDLQNFITALDPFTPLPTLQVIAYDQINLAATINYLVTRQINSDMDHGHKNYYLYRDSNRTREWQPIIWDVDLSWGHDWTPAFNYFDDALVWNHPLDAHAGDNRLYYLIYAFPEMRAMFLRRMRTLMDEILEPPGTTNGQLESLMRGLIDAIDPDPAEPSPWTDADRDFNLWGTWGRGLPPRPETEFVIANYLVPRRAFLFDQNPTTRPRLPGNIGEPIPDSPQVNVPAMVVFDDLDFLPVSGNQAEEYLILRNTTSQAIDISGWTIDGGVTHTFLGGTVIPAGDGSPAANYQGLLHVVKDASAFRTRTMGPTGGQRRFVQGNYTGQLTARGDTAILRDNTGMIVASISYPGDPTPWQEGLRLSEIHYHPADPTAAELVALPGASNGDFEFLEFVNIGTSPLDLAGVTFTEGITFAFPAAVLAPGERVILAKNPAAFAVRYPAVAVPVFGPYDGSLDNIGEQIQFTDAVGEDVLSFDYRNSWYPVTDGFGRSLVVRDPLTAPFDAYGDPTSWAISSVPGGSPGFADTAFAQAYYGWDNFHFSSAERDQPELAGPNADADLDGRSNWQEYAFGTDPRLADHTHVQFAWIEQGAERLPGLQFRRAANALDLSFELVASSELTAAPESWTVVAATANSVTPIDDMVELARYVDSQPAADFQRFYRIRTTFMP